MSVEVYHSLSGLPDQFEKVWRFPKFTNFFLSLDWFECLYETALKSSMELRIYVASDQQRQPVAALVCGVDSGGKVLSNLGNYYSIEFGLAVFKPENNLDQAAGDIVTFIANERPRWVKVDLQFMILDSPATGALVRSFSATGFRVHTSAQYDNWYLGLDNRSFTEYFSSRSKKIRKTIPYMERKIRRTDEIDISVYTEDDLTLQKAIDEYVLVYNNSWKNNEPYPEFIPALMRLGAKLGILRLGVLYLNGTPVATQLWLEICGSAVIYKIAYDENFKDLSVGSILSMDLFRRAIDQDKVDEINYGVGSEAYKQDWMESKRNIVRIQAFNTGTLTGLSSAIALSIKLRIKKLTGRGSEDDFN